MARRTLFSGQKLLTVIFDVHFGLCILCALRIWLVIAAQYRLISQLFYLTTVGCHFLLACLLYMVIHTERQDCWCLIFCNACSEGSLLRPRHVTGVNRHCFQSKFHPLPIILSETYGQKRFGRSYVDHSVLTCSTNPTDRHLAQWSKGGKWQTIVVG